MSLFPKFKIATATPAIPAIPATFSPKSSRSSGSSNPRATQKNDFQVSGDNDPILTPAQWWPEFHRLQLNEGASAFPAPGPHPEIIVERRAASAVVR